VAYEYRSTYGLIRLLHDARRWKIEFDGTLAGSWDSADSAVSALVGRASGIAAWDVIETVDVPDDILDWTPLADSL